MHEHADDGCKYGNNANNKYSYVNKSLLSVTLVCFNPLRNPYLFCISLLLRFKSLSESYKEEYKRDGNDDMA